MSTLLNPNDRTGYKATENEEAEYFYEDEEWNISRTTKNLLIACGVVLSVAIIYLFCFILPNMFIPKLVNLVGISKVQDLAVSLVPVSLDVVETWNVEAWDNLEYDEEEQTEQTEQTEQETSELSVADSKKTVKQRLIIIGDIHGQYIQFRKLLRKVGFNKKTDHVLVLGDFIAKGPDSMKVLEYLIENQMDCILGNHEYYALQNYAQFHGLQSPYFVAQNSSNALRNPDLSSKSSQMSNRGFNEDPEYLLAKKLQPHHIEYINLCGVIKKLGKVPLHASENDGGRNFASGLAVHAGLRWDLTADLNEQDPNDCLEMRSYLEPFYNETTDDPRAERAVSWSKVWNAVNKNKTVDHQYVVYYGHDAHRGLNLKKWAKGLDNGCVRGDYLAAMVLWQEETKRGVLYKEQAVRVSC